LIGAFSDLVSVAAVTPGAVYDFIKSVVPDDCFCSTAADVTLLLLALLVVFSIGNSLIALFAYLI
jgi:hypothetical protein